MSRHMRTTVRLDDSPAQPRKEHATRERRTLTSLIEEGLALVLEKPGRERRRAGRPAGLQGRRRAAAGVDLNNNAALLDFLDEP